MSEPKKINVGAEEAKLVSVEKRSMVVERAAAVRRIGKLGRRLSLRGLKIKDLIAEGRK